MFEATDSEATDFEAILPPGAYLLGDLCLTLREDLYDDIFVPWRERNGIHKTEQGPVFAFASTAHGDGLFADDDGGEFPVDAGNIGLVDVRIARPFLREEACNGPIHYLESDEEIFFGFDRGVISVEWEWFDGGLWYKKIDTDETCFDSDTDASLLDE